MRHYELYGLTLRANCVLRGLATAPWDSPPDVEIRLGSLPPQMSQTAPRGSQIRREDLAIDPKLYEPGPSGYYRMVFQDGTAFAVDRSGWEVWGAWPSNFTLEDAVTYLVSTVMGLVLALRGVTCLHGSAAVVGERAVVFAGAAGAGKSTTAAIFAKRGYAVLVDDIVALDERGEDFLVRPGYPRVCLWPDAAERLFGSLPLLTPNWTKRYLDLQDGHHRFHSRPAKLAGIYLLSVSEESAEPPRVEEVPRGNVLIQLIANSYMWYLLDREQRAQEFAFLGRVANHVPIRRLIRAKARDQAEKMCDVVVKDFESATAPEQPG